MESPLESYITRYSTPLHEALAWIEKQTHIRTNYPRMLSGPVQGELLKLLVQISGARRVLEIGSFTGYSTACLALGLPEDGHIDALEINDELEDLMREGWKRAGVADRISLHIGDAVQTLRSLEGEYDFAYIDANKRQYPEYYELTLPLLRSGGVIVADDVLWDGKVYSGTPSRDAQTQALLAFNAAVSQDPRVEVVMLPLRDGLSIIRKM